MGWSRCFRSGHDGVLAVLQAASGARKKSAKVVTRNKAKVDRGAALVRPDCGCDESGKKKVEEAKRQKRVKDGQAFIKNEVLRELSAIVTKMLDEAKSGKTAALRLLWDLGNVGEGVSKTVKRKEQTLSEILLAEWKRVDAHKAASLDSGLPH